MLCLTFLHFHLDSYIVNKGGEEVKEVSLMAKFRKMHLKFGKIHMFRGGLHLFRGSFLVAFSVEFVFCSACDHSLPFFGFGHELSFFVFLSSYFLSLNFISRYVLSMHSSRGRLRTRSVPVVDG
jgi:hypothetical protein